MSYMSSSFYLTRFGDTHTQIKHKRYNIFDWNLLRYSCIERATRYNIICTLSTYHVIALRVSHAKGLRGNLRVLAACHRFRLQPRTSFRLRSHSSGKFLIVCPAPSGEFARSRHGDGHRSLPAAWPPVFMSTGHNRGIPSVPGSFSDPRPAGPLMVMVITGPNCKQWNYEISKFAATVLSSTHAYSFHCIKVACARSVRKELIWFNYRHLDYFQSLRKILLDSN